MKKFYFFIAVFLIISVLQHSHAREVKRVSIDKYGLSEDTRDSRFCKKFKPTVGEVKDFFSKAYPVDLYLAAQTFYSPCYAEGTVEYADGNRGIWTLKSSGIARINWERSGWVVLFYSQNKWYDPFAGMYDDNGV